MGYNERDLRKIDFRQKQVKLRKNFLPTLLAASFLWVLVVMVVFFVDPERFGSIPLFFVLTFLATFITLSVLFANSRRGLIFSVSFCVFLLLRYFGVGGVFNFLLILGLALVIEFYFSKK